MRPPVPYFGGKMTIAPNIAALLPPHGHYVGPTARLVASLNSNSRRPTVADSRRYLIAQTVAAHVDLLARNPDGTLLQDRPDGALMACSCSRWSTRVTAETLSEAWDEFRLHRADAILTALDGAQ